MAFLLQLDIGLSLSLSQLGCRTDGYHVAVPVSHLSHPKVFWTVQISPTLSLSKIWTVQNTFERLRFRLALSTTCAPTHSAPKVFSFVSLKLIGGILCGMQKCSTKRSLRNRSNCPSLLICFGPPVRSRTDQQSKQSF